MFKTEFETIQNNLYYQKKREKVLNMNLDLFYMKLHFQSFGLKLNKKK
jgi:hypothetical protein